MICLRRNSPPVKRRFAHCSSTPHRKRGFAFAEACISGRRRTVGVKVEVEELDYTGVLIKLNLLKILRAKNVLSTENFRSASLRMRAPSRS